MPLKVLDGSNILKVSLYVKNASISMLLENGAAENPMLVSAIEFVKKVILLVLFFYPCGFQFVRGCLFVSYKCLIISKHLNSLPLFAGWPNSQNLGFIQHLQVWWI